MEAQVFPQDHDDDAHEESSEEEPVRVDQGQWTDVGSQLFEEVAEHVLQIVEVLIPLVAIPSSDKDSVDYSRVDEQHREEDDEAHAHAQCEQ